MSVRETTESEYSNYDGKNPEAFVQQIAGVLRNPPDLVYRKLALSTEVSGYCLFIQTLADKAGIEQSVLRFLSEPSLACELELSKNALDVIESRIPFSSIEVTKELKQCIRGLLNGHCLLVFSSMSQILVLDTSKSAHRNVTEPLIESTVQGPAEGFTEDLATNISLLRKRIKNAHFCIEQFVIGTETETKVNLLYLGNLAPEGVVDEFRNRIHSIRIDSVLDSNYIEEWIQDKTMSPFSTILDTERPDVVASHLLEGRVGVLVDGSPDALIGPITFFQLFISPEDYYQRADIATLLRWLRVLSFLMAVLIPALYIAVVSYHQELLPHSLLISIAAQREGVPFPAIIEALVMMITFEVLHEAGLRMPRVAGQTISIVGALVLGQAAVQAGLVSAVMVIVVSVTAISNFVAPTYNFGITQRILQFFYMILAGTVGFYGVLCGVLFTVVHLASIKSFGVPYLTPIAPITTSDWKDILVRLPRLWMNSYPRMNRTKKKRRSNP
ncbi:spore germination protein KA [Paenibacillus tianmuensis]|uniref:Spore germination protein KA n=1 Tax=Paenibacillus tianmuensis TaxID=624147 RepID=A0A1G4PWX9_9BACL|nr:spore germination protein [Paenibacillus tianmuensis]SCW36671.1 spore germination protein KA [Paenibacillus tianmuensis]